MQTNPLALLLLSLAADPAWLEDRFELPPGFRIYRAAGRDLSGGSYDIAFDGQGRLLAGDGEAVRRLEDRDGDGLFDHSEVMARGLGPRGPQGLLVVGDRLYAVGGDGVQLFDGYLSGGPPVHRGRIGNPFSTGGDHAAHTVLRGHDGFIYFITGDGGGTRERVHITEETSPALFERSASVFRVSADGSRWECFGTGGRNPPNVGMNYLGDLFSLDSDMEWHVDLPWWRPVRLHHWTAGGDQGWQEVGAYPPYYIDNLPGIHDVGRGSPDWGVFYEHRGLPDRYRDSYLVCDYPSKSATTGGYETVGRLFVFFLERDGAGWKATHEVLARPRPGARDENGRAIQFALVDIEVAPDGSIFLSDHNQGIWRIVHDAAESRTTAAPPIFPPWPPLPAGEAALVDALVSLPQPASEWSRVREEQIVSSLGAAARPALESLSASTEAPIEKRLRAIRLIAPGFASLDPGLLDRLARDPAWEIRAQAAWLLGIRGKPDEVERIESLLDDADSFVRRRAAEALARSHRPATPARLIPRLADPVRLVRYVAMTSLSHHPSSAWLDAGLARPEPQARMRALVAADIRKERPPAEAIRGVAVPLLDALGSGAAREDRLDLLRILGRFREAIQADDAAREKAARHLLDSLGDTDPDIRWEAARLLGEYRVADAFGKLLAALEAEKDHVREFHIAQALARIPRGWSAEEEERAVGWFLARQEGWFAEPAGKGLQFPDFWRTVLSEMSSHHKEAFRRRLREIRFSGPFGAVALDLVAEMPDAAAVLIARWRASEGPEARERIAAVLGRVPDPAAGAFLREEYLGTTHAGLRGAIVRGLARREPAAEDIPFLLEGLSHDDEDAVRASLGALSRWKGLGPEEALAARLVALLLRRERMVSAAEDLLAKASGKERPGRRREGGRRRRLPEGEIDAARAFWKAWYAETFKREFDPDLAAPPGEKSDEDVRAFLASDRARGGDAVRGRKVYIDARCSSCHGGAGEPGKEERLFGPDLAGVTLRLKREELVDGIVYPSKQLADRFKGTLVLVRGGTPVTGFITEQSAEAVVIAGQDRVERIPRDDIESIVPLETSLMPERLLSRLSWEEIRDLSAFLEEVGRRQAGSAGGEWPGWRGPGGRGVSPEEGLPTRWSSSEGVGWSRDLEGRGNSSPVVAAGRLYVTEQTEDDALHVIAFDPEDGRVLWRTSVGKGRLKAHELNNMASPTPATDGERVWALFGTGDLACLDRDGRVIWRRNLAADHGEYKILWGMGSSPFLHGGLIYCLCLHGGPSYVLAVDPATGKDVWKAPRDLPCRAEATDSYSTPIVLETEGRCELIVGGRDHVNAYDPATGKELWIASGMGIDHDWGRTIASPAVGGGMVFVPSASVQGLGKLVAIRAGGDGDAGSGRRLWQYDKFTPDCPSPLYHDGLVYMVRDDGVGSCLDAKTGELLWKKRLGQSEFKASPVAGDGKVYFLDDAGNCVVLEAGREGKVIAENQLEGRFFATPALAGGRIYLRAASRVYAVGPGGP
jgi:putative heme-binding domain-containing protein